MAHIPDNYSTPHSLAMDGPIPLRQTLFVSSSLDDPRVSRRIRQRRRRDRSRAEGRRAPRGLDKEPMNIFIAAAFIVVVEIWLDVAIWRARRGKP